VLDGQLGRAQFVGPPVLDHRSDAASTDSHAGYKAFRLAPDGRWIEFRAVARDAKGATSQLVRLDLAERRLLLPGAAAPGDGTIRWYRTRAEGSAAAGSEALALFVHPDRQRWILWTPEGVYDASPGGGALLGYRLNNGRNAAGSFISSAQLQQRFYRPDLVARRLVGRPEDGAAVAKAVAEVGDVRTSLSTASLPPAAWAAPNFTPCLPASPARKLSWCSTPAAPAPSA
jgi:hypothetical protein